MSELFEYLCGSVPRETVDKIPPVTLAYVGDTIFDLYLRTELALGDPMSPHEMHRQASLFARAGAQARMAQKLLPLLSEQEEGLLKRARNQRSISVPRNADPVDYKWATGLEALLGYLYLTGQEQRLYQLISEGMKRMREDEMQEEGGSV